jgi:hypothetical protein
MCSTSYCPDGTYSLVKPYFHNGGNWNQEPWKCPVCPLGKAAVKVYQIEHFEEWPESVEKKCLVIDHSLAGPEECEKSYGWTIDYQLETIAIVSRKC